MKIKQLKQQNLKQLLTGEFSLRIPDYQRPYKWQDSMVVEFFEDITSAMERGENEYFLGSLIFVSLSPREYDILDGQQRITTSVILLTVLRDILQPSNSSLASQIQNEFLLKDSLPNLRTRSEDQSAFRRVFLDDSHRAIDSDFSRLPKAFATATKTFHTLLEQKTETNPDYPKQLLGFLMDSIQFVVMITDELSSAYTIFETINNRGTPLEAKDLLKNFLLKELYEECQKRASNERAQKALFDQQTEEFKANWQRAESADIDMNIALILHREAITGVRTRKDLFKEIVSLYQTQDTDALTFMDDWLQSIEAYESVIGGEIHNDLSNRTRSTLHLLLNGSNRYWQPILVSAIRQKYPLEDIEQLIYELERWIALSRIAGFSSSKLRDPSLQIIRLYIHEGLDIESIHTFLEQFIARYRVSERALQSLMGNCYDASWCRYVLAKYEYEIADASIDRVIPFGRTTQVEHILPQRMTAKEWTSVFSPEDHDQLVNTIGNLTLLIGSSKKLKSSKNQRASNKPFAEKMHVYMGLAENDGVSAFHMTSSLNQYKQWTPEIIRQRQKQIIDVLANAWDLNPEQIEKQQRLHQERFAKAVDTISFKEGDFSVEDLGQLLQMTLEEDGKVIPRLITMLRILLDETGPIDREDLREKMFKAGVGDSIGQAGRLMSNVSQLLTRPGNEHLRQIVQFSADIRAGAKKDGYFIPQEYHSMVERVLDTIQDT